MKKMYQIPELQVVILDSGELPFNPDGGLFHFFG